MTLWNWWKARQFHIVPEFRGFCVSGLNIAESGQSLVKDKEKCGFVFLHGEIHMP